MYIVYIHIYIYIYIHTYIHTYIHRNTFDMYKSDDIKMMIRQIMIAIIISVTCLLTMVINMDIYYLFSVTWNCVGDAFTTWSYRILQLSVGYVFLLKMCRVIDMYIWYHMMFYFDLFGCFRHQSSSTCCFCCGSLGMITGPLPLWRNSTTVRFGDFPGELPRGVP